MTFTIFGNDILEEGGYIVRPFDAGAFALQHLKRDNILEYLWGYEF